MQKLLILIVLSLLPFICANSQGAGGTDDLAWDEFISIIDESDDAEYTLSEDLVNELYTIHSNPYNINEVTLEELEDLPFISASQAEEIIKYVKTNGPVQSLGELMMIGSISEAKRKALRLFLCVKNPEERNVSASKMLKNGKHEAVWRTDVPLYSKAGFKEVDPEVLKKNPNKVYQGDRFHNSFRYSFSSYGRLMAGVQIDKDPGESGLDYKTFYVMLKNVGPIKEAVAGSFKVSYGKGLVTNTSTKFGKTMMTNAIDRIDEGVRKYSGMGEWDYFNGAAFTLRIKKWEFSSYFSSKHVDGTFTADSAGISSFKKDGLHRTMLERSKKGNVSKTDAGGNIHWGNDHFMVSASFAYTHLDTPLLPSFKTPSTLYRKYQARGKDFVVGSISYLYRKQNFVLSGETAYSSTEYQNGAASLNSMQWKMNDYNTLSVTGRYYGAKFVSINGKAFGENSNVQNEAGLFVSLVSQSLKNIQINAYADLMYFPVLKYGVSSSSYAFESAIQALYARNQRTNFMFRYKIKSKQKDFKLVTSSSNTKAASNSSSSATKSGTIIGWRITHNAKLSMNSNLSASWMLRASASAVLITTNATSSKAGFSVSSGIRWKRSANKGWADLNATCFYTDDYETKVYGYETSMPYSYGGTSFFYHGMRVALTGCVPIISKHLFLNGKIGSTIYFNRDHISSGLDLISATHREDVQIQMKWIF